MISEKDLFDQIDIMLVAQGLDAASAKAIKDLAINAFNDLSRTTVIGESGAGLVKVYARNGTVNKVEIDDKVMTDKAFLQDLLVGAFVDLRNKADTLLVDMQQKLQDEIVSAMSQPLLSYDKNLS